MNQNYKITITYNGSRYNGWQKQGNTKNTIQEKLEDIFSRYFGESVEITGSGRTDAGVHALGQIASFKLSRKIEEPLCDRILEINSYLPADIRILDIKPADPRFHPRLNAIKKHYRYVIDTSPSGNPFFRKFSMHYNIPLNIELMEKACSYLIGTHDFASFCANKKMKKSTVRTIYDINILREGEFIILDYFGNGFLYNMVRILTGTLILVGNKTISPESVRDIIETKNRQSAGFTAPPDGLYLVEVFY